MWYHQDPHTQFPPASPGGFARSAGGSDQFLSTIASALGPRAGEILCVPFKSEVSISHCPLILQKEAKLHILGAYLLGAEPQS